MYNEIKGAWCLETPDTAKSQEPRIKTIQTTKKRVKRMQIANIALLKKWGMVSNN